MPIASLSSYSSGRVGAFFTSVAARRMQDHDRSPTHHPKSLTFLCASPSLPLHFHFCLRPALAPPCEREHSGPNAVETDGPHARRVASPR